MKRREALNYVALGSLLPAPDLSSQHIPMQETESNIKVVHSVEHLQLLSFKAGDLVQTLGYYQPGDGGAAMYRIHQKKELDELLLNTSVELFEHVSSDLVASLFNLQTAQYKIFGARGVKGHEDGSAIRKTHEFANRKCIPVQNLQGEFYIDSERDIPIETDVRWGQTVFHIDETYHNKQPVFHVRSRLNQSQLLPDAVKKAILSQIKPGTKIIAGLADYKNHLIHLIDDQDRIGFRAGPYQQTGRPKEELLYVEEGGKLIGDIAWTFNETVSIEAIPLDPSYLTIDGGTFFLSGSNPTGQPSGYVNNGIYVSRSRTILKNQWVGLEDGQADEGMLAQSGFYYFAKVYHMQMENIRLIPREKDRVGEDRDVPHGTYGIGGNRVLNLQLRNVTAEGDWMHWGVFGTNMMKDVYLQNCRLNRFDVHFHLWNLTIRDCHIGYKGISITGGGKLVIENTSVQQNALVNFRRDYGSRWDGSITIRDCQQLVTREGDCRILSFRASDFNYGYPIGLPEQIVIQNVTIDFTSVPNNDGDAWIIETSNIPDRKIRQPFQFPSLIKIEDVQVHGRSKGLRFLSIGHLQDYQSKQPGRYDHQLVPNAKIIVRNVQVADDLFLSLQSTNDGSVDELKPYIKLHLEDLINLKLDIKNIPANISISHAIVHNIQLGDEALFMGKICLQNCSLEPIPREQVSPIFEIKTDLGTTLINCTLSMPMLDGMERSDLLSQTGIFRINQEVYFNHIQTSLTKDIYAFLKKEGLELNPDFLHRLMLCSDAAT